MKIRLRIEFLPFIPFPYEIKPSAHQPKRPRKTVLKRFRELLKQRDLPLAGGVATYGRELSPLERLFHRYYKALDTWEEIVKKGKLPHPFWWQPPPGIMSFAMQMRQKELKELEAEISRMFLQAVKTHDRKAIMEIADAVCFFKDKRSLTPIMLDSVRLCLLDLKGILHVAEASGQKVKITIRTIAEFVNQSRGPDKPKIESSDDGYSSLRRKCKELGVPIADSRKLRKK